MSNSMTSLRRCVAKYCYTYWFCCLLLSLVIVPTTAKLADQPDGSKKSHNKNEVVEGSGAFRGIAQHGEDPDWQAASGSSPDDEPGDDADDDDEHTLDGSGHMIEGSGDSHQVSEHSVENSYSTQFTTTLQTTTRQVVEGSGAFRGIAQHGEDPDWQAASKSRLDNKLGDYAGDDDEHTLDGSGRKDFRQIANYYNMRIFNFQRS